MPKSESLDARISSTTSSNLEKFDARTFWQEHDRTLAQDGSPSDVTLSHDLYRGMPGWFNAYYAHFQQRAVIRLLQKCRLQPGMRSLDIGCGTGRWSGLLLNLNLTPFGIDIGEQALHYAAHRWHDAFFSCSVLPRLAFANNSFELAISVVVLQHIPRAQQPHALQEISRVLKPGGHLLVCESVDTGDPSPHVFGNQSERWVEMFRSAGFCLIAQSACEYLPHIKVFQKARSIWQGKAKSSPRQANVSQVAQVLRTHLLLAAVVRLVIIISYPLEYLAAWICPPRWARLACFLLRKC